ncbi:MAG TPA: PQQ-binding-like beta-propeller repeat protein [Bryobacteraceae bacterium]|jgi:alcohol dehydrogenase (cytochrome c)|nr:PQQ-binding-like beta-propeller repeat protein [Bryobacteraceae bacterium]
MNLRLFLPPVLLASSLLAQVTYERLLHADREPQNWLTYSGSYSGDRYSSLNQINRENVKDLQLKWVYHPLYRKTSNNQSKMENTPLVVDGIMYTGTALEVVALDAVTGRQYWKLSRPLDPTAYYNAYEVNKGMAISGNTLFWATVDCHLLAIDTKTGKIIWDKEMTNFKKGYQYNVAPLIVRNMIILGPATNEAGANCWVEAFDTKTGKRLWRTYTAPMSADQPEAKTWAGDSWKHAGDPIWNGGAYDPETNLTFWGTGNPNPGWNGDPRAPGDNLWSDSVIALDADTGKMKWYYQFTPGDEYDWDATQVPVLTTINWKGEPRKVMLWANRNGFFYVLDRTTGKYLMGKPFVKQNWNLGIDEDGRPIKDPKRWPKPMGGTLIEPGNQGGTNWYPPSFSPLTGLFYISTWQNSGGPSPKGDPGKWVEGQRYTGTGRPARLTGAAAAGQRRARASRAMTNYKTEDEGYGAIIAVNPTSGETVWDFKMVSYTENGVLSTGGNLVFGGGMEGNFVALDGQTGKLLWHVNLGGQNAAGPISYAVNGKQYIIGTGEGTMFAFALPD